MKKFKNIKLMLIGLFAMVGMNAFAQELTDGTLKFTASGKNATITGFAKDKASADVVIESTIKNIATGESFTVVGIADGAFNGSGVKNIDLKASGVGVIGAKTFQNLATLESIKLTSAITNITEGAFIGTKIKDLDLSKTKVTKIRNWFGTNVSYKTEAYELETAEDVYEANKELAGAGAFSKDDPDYDNPKHYTEEEAAAYNANPANFDGRELQPIAPGDPLKYSYATANEYNKTVFPSAGAVVAGDFVTYTAAEAAAYNASLPGALPANTELTYSEARVFNKFVTGMTDTEVKAAILLYNSKLPGARSARTDGGTGNILFDYSGDAYDWNKAHFAADDPEFVLSPTYTAGEAAAWNAAHPDETPVVIDQKKADAYESDGITLKAGYATTLKAATEAHQAKYGIGAAVKGDVWFFENEAGANNFNTGLKGAFAASDVTGYRNKVANKKEGDKLTVAEANTYNKTLTDGEGNPAAVSEGDFVMDGDEKTVYTDETAYTHNMTLAAENGYNFVMAGSNTGATATAATAAEYNASLPGAVKAGDESGQYEKLGMSKANTKNEVIITAAKGKPYNLSDNKWVKARTIGAVDYPSLTQVELPAAWVSIETKEAAKGSSREIGAFEGCTKLATVDFGGNAANKNIDKDNADATTISIGENAFLGTALTAIDLSKTFVDDIPATLIVDGELVTTNSSLTTVTLNPFITSIPAGIFADCTGLTTVTFPKDYQQLTEDEKKLGVLDDYSKAVIFNEYYPLKSYYPSFVSIGAKAFANTAIASFRLPATYIVGEVVSDIIDTEEGSSNVPCVDASAFSGCKNLKEFIFLPNSVTPDQEVDDMAFPGCKGIIFKTTHAYMTTNEDAPKNSKYELFVAGYQTEFVTNEFKKTPGKYYIKYYATKNIRVKKDEAKVYNAYLDATDYTLNMCLYKAQGGYYEIAPGATVLIITNNKKLQFEDGTLDGSWLQFENELEAYLYAKGVLGYGDADALEYVEDNTDNINALKIVMNEDGIARTDLDAEAGVGMVVYGWVNSATAGTGFQKITTGDKFKAGTMYILAAEPAEDARLNVRWLDENGNVDSEATGIKTINTVNADSDEIFNLQGVRVNKAQKGLYIINGKKVVK